MTEFPLLSPQLLICLRLVFFVAVRSVSSFSASYDLRRNRSFSALCQNGTPMLINNTARSMPGYLRTSVIHFNQLPSRKVNAMLLSRS